MATYFITQSGAGSQNGSSLIDAWSASNFNSSGNWSSTPATSGKISPGDTVIINGTITSQLNVQSSGLSGNVITFLWATNAKLSQPAGTLMTCPNKGYLVFDGGSNGIIECTDNGSSLGNQIGVSGIYTQGTTNIEVKNLAFQNLYVHSLLSDSIIDEGSNAALYLTGATVGIQVRNCSFSNVCWAILTAGTGSNFVAEDCSFTNYDHGVATGNNPFVIRRNQFGSTANWDTTSNRYHHDGIHMFFPGGNVNNGPVEISSNIFYGNWGSNNTAHIFMEGDWTHVPNSVNNVVIRNNIHIQFAGNYLNNGMCVGGGINWKYENNTYLGSSVYNGSAVSFGQCTNLVFTNNVVSGVNTFLSGSSSTTFATNGLTNNIYAAVGPGGNPPFSLSGAISTFSAWKSATGQDANSQYILSAGLDSSALIQAGSAAIGNGKNLSSEFTTDKNGATRTIPWDVGGYKYTSANPAVVSASIPSLGTSVIISLSTSCTNGSGGASGMTISASGGSATLSYAGGSGSTSYVYAISRTINLGETVTISYTQPGNGIEATSGGLDLLSFSGFSVSNGSTQSAVPIPTVPPTRYPRGHKKRR